jgi:hypothetical protein
VGEVARAGPYAAFLGSAYNPVWTEFHGQATRNTVKTLAQQKLDVAEPYMGVTPDSRFTLASVPPPSPDFTLDRLDRDGELTLSSLRGRNVVLVFYPLAFSSSCTKELTRSRPPETNTTPPTPR